MASLLERAPRSPAHRAPRRVPAAPHDAHDARTRDLDLVRVARAVWSELPLMAAISLLVTLASGLTAIAAVAVAPLAPLVAALTLGPVWIGAVAIVGDVLDGTAVGIRDLLVAVRRLAGAGIAIAMAPAAVATLLIGSLVVLNAHPDQGWLLLPIAVDATAVALLALGSYCVYPLAVVGQRTGRDRWRLAMALAGRNPMTTLGMAGLLVLIALSVQRVGPFPAVILAGPLAVLCTAVTRSLIARAIAEVHP